MSSPEGFWGEWQKLITEYVEKYIGNSREIYDAAVKVVGSETDPEKKLRKLYARAQQIRNLSYERERSETEIKREKLKENQSALDVLKHGFGDDYDIYLFFVALARAAGFDASVLAVSDRSRLSFNKLLLFQGQIGKPVALVRLDGKDLILEPGTQYCPFGLTQWKHSSAT